MQPFVSCIMPTYNRRQFIPHAIRYFLRQYYESKELIVIDDGTDPVKDLMPEHPAIRYFYLDKKITLGAKLNIACHYAKGDIIAHWDDDDWYAPWRLGYQVSSLQENGNLVCGINHLLYYDLRCGTAFEYIYPPGQRPWLLGSSLCYKKGAWRRNLFADIDVGMDGLFVWNTSPEHVATLTDSRFSVHMIHGSNVSPKKTEGVWWHPYPKESLQTIMADDWGFYNSPEPTLVTSKSNNVSLPQKIIREKTGNFQNIFACLVHENSECVTDLVRNLHYHDPSSRILLYNGGTDSRLLAGGFPWEQFNTFAVPDPVPLKHGYLHNFAIRCMAFALQHFSFDAITIVDSDQLAIRSGYSEYLCSFLLSKPDVGMLSSAPERVTSENKTNRVALQAFREYELWKPLLEQFTDGESSFVHWTFWPSTVFTFGAVTDLVKLFRENEQLQKILAHSKIWASEEVILPTLVRLLGYDIASNPCSYDFVQYKTAYSKTDIASAFAKKDVFWLHPVVREYNNPLRAQVRERYNHYVAKEAGPVPPVRAMVDAGHRALLDRVRKIEGWLSDEEADLLMTVTQNVCRSLPALHNIVEVGSYHGKTTVLFGSIAKECSPLATVFAIDPHDGRLGAVDQGLRFYPPSYEMFKKNIEKAGLSGVVRGIRSRSYEVTWSQPVSLLFIDGLHDYLNVARDFHHFADWLVPAGYAAFHDYAPYFPGVQAFVDGLLQAGSYQKIALAGSLVILQKK